MTGTRVANRYRAVVGGALQKETWASQSGLERWKKQTCVVIVWI